MSAHFGAPPRRRELKGWHVLAAMLAFFGTIVAVDSVLIYKAVSTFGGIESANAYRDGLAYNARLAVDAKQAKLGWTEKLEVAGSPQRLSVTLVGADGAGISRRHVVADVGRPATNRFDRTLDLVEVAPGRYEAAFGDAEPGTWTVALRVFERRDDSAEPVYRVRRRLWVAP